MMHTADLLKVFAEHRGDAIVPTGLSEAQAIEEARRHEKVAPHLAGKTLRKVVYVPGRILNLVVEG